MASVTVTYRNGRVAQLENIYIRGSKIRFLILPGKSSIHSCWCQFLCFPSSDMLRNAPMFKNMMTRRRGGAARGKSGILWAQAGAGGRGRGRSLSSDRGGDERRQGRIWRKGPHLWTWTFLSYFEVHACSVGKWSLF